MSKNIIQSYVDTAIETEPLTYYTLVNLKNLIRDYEKISEVYVKTSPVITTALKLVIAETVRLVKTIKLEYNKNILSGMSEERAVLRVNRLIKDVSNLTDKIDTEIIKIIVESIFDE